MEQEEKNTTYNSCFYTPISFVLFLIALTFPITNVTLETIAIYNLWIALLFELLPIHAPFAQYLKDAKFDAECNPLKTRQQFVDFVFDMHFLVLKERLDKQKTLFFFEQLRANECSQTSSGTEGTCRRTTNKKTNVCLIRTSVSQKPLTSFETTTSSMTTTNTSMTSEQPFVSCIFSAKWFLLHMIASHFPKTTVTASQQYQYHTFLMLFGKILACIACRVNFQSNLELVRYNVRSDLKDRESFVDFICRLHDTVNTMLKKPLYPHEKTINLFHKLTILSSQKNVYCVVIITPEEKNQRERFLLETEIK